MSQKFRPTQFAGRALPPVRLILALLLCLSALGGCKSKESSAQAQGGAPAMQGPSHVVQLGRATIRIPAGSTPQWTTSEVNQVFLSRVSGSGTLDALWADRMATIRAGKAEAKTHSTVDREFAGQHSVLYNTSGDIGNLRTLEHWQTFGSAIIRGTTVMSPEELPLGQKAIADLFAAVDVQKDPGRGDFAFDGGVAHVNSNGEEEVRAEWTETVQDAVHGHVATVKFSLMTDAVTEPGKPDVLENLAGAKSIAATGGVSFSVLRAGKLTLAGMEGEEQVTTIKARVTTFSATWQSAGKANNALAPATELHMDCEDTQGVDPQVLLTRWQQALQSLSFR